MFLNKLIIIAISLCAAQFAFAGDLNIRLNQEEQIRFFDNLTHSKLENSKVTLLHLGKTSRPVKLNLIKNAKNFVFMKTPYWFDDKAGNEIADAFAEAKLHLPANAEKVIIDWVTPFGSKQLFKQTVIKKVRQIVGESNLFEWNNLFSLRDFSFNLLKYRVHDKVLVVDAKTAIIGGMNAADEYLYGGETEKGWHDTDIMLEGPAAREITRLFLIDYELGKALAGGMYFPPSDAVRTKVLQDIYWNNLQNYPFKVVNNNSSASTFEQHFDHHEVSIPFKDNYDASIYYPELSEIEKHFTSPVRVIYDNKLIDRDQNGNTISKIGNTARAMFDLSYSRVRLILPYLTLTPEMRDALVKTAKRGVRVEIITNSSETNDLGRKSYMGAAQDTLDLLAAGVQVYAWRGHAELLKIQKENNCKITDWPGETVHTKGISFDGQVLLLGSNNLNTRSEMYNNEIAALVNDEKYASQFESIFENDLDNNEAERYIKCGEKKFSRSRKVEKLELESYRKFVDTNQVEIDAASKQKNRM